MDLDNINSEDEGFASETSDEGYNSDETKNEEGGYTKDDLEIDVEYYHSPNNEYIPGYGCVCDFHNGFVEGILENRESPKKEEKDEEVSNISPFSNNNNNTTTTTTTIDNNPVLIPQSSIPSAATNGEPLKYVLPGDNPQDPRDICMRVFDLNPVLISFIRTMMNIQGQSDKNHERSIMTINEDKSNNTLKYLDKKPHFLSNNRLLCHTLHDITLREVFDKVQNVPISNSKYPQMIQAIGHINRNMKAMLHKRGGEATYNDFNNDTEKKENVKEFNDHAPQKNSFSNDNIPITKDFDHDNASFIIKDNYTSRETHFSEDNTTTINNKEDEDDEIKKDSDNDEVFVDDDSDNANFIIKDNYTSRETHFSEDNTTTINNKEDEDDEGKKEDSDNDEVFVDDDSDNANFIIMDNYSSRETHFSEGAS
ncbi:asparagine-rich protein-like [Palaemon carinicauda]|uniref:asparagine-rich protein-like n=1 Tax=Palaemon carinicauda TaxID=392227 RepID=UPI0035B6391B